MLSFPLTSPVGTLPPLETWMPRDDELQPLYPQMPFEPTTLSNSNPADGYALPNPVHGQPTIIPTSNLLAASAVPPSMSGGAVANTSVVPITGELSVFIQ